MNEGERRLEEYLAELRRRLALPAAATDDVLRELAGHVRDSAGDTLPDDAVAAALERMGSPALLASLYEAEGLMTRAGGGPSPWRLLRGAARWARASLSGLYALLGLALGYLVSASFFLAALIKPFAPARAGLWSIPGEGVSLHLGLVAQPAGEELLGWWLIPIGLAGGLFGLWATTRFGLWSLRRLRGRLSHRLRPEGGGA